MFRHNHIFSIESKNKYKNEDEKKQSFEYKNIQISVKLSSNIEVLNKIFDKAPDLVKREIKIASNPKNGAILVYIANMIHSDVLENVLIKKLIAKSQSSPYDISNVDYFKYLLGVNNNSVHCSMYKVVDEVLNGKVVIFIEGIEKAIVVDLRNAPNRDITEPDVENIVRGPREGFTEDIATNIVLIRKKIKNPYLKIEQFVIGKQTKTNVDIVYLSNIANSKIVEELRERIKRIDIDAVLGSSYLKEYIEDEPISRMPTIFSTERPDVVAGKLLDGRIAILVDGTPVVSTVPAIFSEFLETSEDFYVNFIDASFNRGIRYVSLILSIALPGFYVAITTFHQELIPTQLLVSFIKARSDVPYSSLFECFFVLLIYEILREAGLRMPRAVGQAVSVVGALVLGQSAVEAGLVSTPMVIVISTTAIASYTIPSIEMYTATVIPRFIFLFLGGFLGLLALVPALIIFFLKLISIRSFGVPYMEPLAPFVKSDFPDIIIRRPFWAKNKRSRMVTGSRSYKRKPFNRFLWIKFRKKERKNKE